MFVAWELYDLRDLAWFSVLDLHYADPAQPLATAGGELDDLDRDLSDLSDLSVRRVKAMSRNVRAETYFDEWMDHIKLIMYPTSLA